MGACAEVECPICHKKFVVSPSALGKSLELHCPFCDGYFKEEESPKIWK